MSDYVFPFSIPPKPPQLKLGSIVLSIVLFLRACVVDAFRLLRHKIIGEKVASPYLEGNYGPVSTEHAAVPLQVVEGEIPKDIDGMFVRNGPNPQFAPIWGHHWFDGDGMTHGVRVSKGKAYYTNKYVRTEKFLRENKAGKALRFGLGDFGSVWIFFRFLVEGVVERLGLKIFPNLCTANTSVKYHAGRFFSLVEASPPTHQTLPSLHTVGPFTFAGKYKSSFTAHPKVDPETGEMLFFGYAADMPPYLRYAIADKSGAIIHNEAIDLPISVMMHDFAITTNYSIFMYLPLTFRVGRLLTGGELLAFEEESPAYFGIIPRYGTNQDVVWIQVKNCMVFHTMAAYEDKSDGSIVVIGNRYEKLNIKLDQLTGGSSDFPVLYEWRFDIHRKSVKERQLADEYTEFPTINEGLMGSYFRYGYCAQITRHDKLKISGLIKYDFQNLQSKKIMPFGKGITGGEGVFIEKKNPSGEDDGYLVTFTYNEATNSSEFIIVDAKSMKLLCRLATPQRVPYGYHGTWVTAEQIDQQK
eukprot:TRINITY_DN7172_c0_g4_i1.p1 TRINITY_DN7172_c0_g4~~TRINITY_DN7172_c0_g4_i1.p1  ORF type:complete len:527 (+),score=120.95 TRINITY_DN7172_c0_g4_i1:58-1638(+)